METFNIWVGVATIVSTVISVVALFKVEKLKSEMKMTVKGNNNYQAGGDIKNVR